MRLARLLRFISFIALTIPLAAQVTTGTLTGRVTQDGNALPGVTVTISSSNLQGTRTTVTNEAGTYNFTALPPGLYNVQFELAGLAPLQKSIHVRLSQEEHLDADLKVSALTEAITVTADAPVVADTTQVQTNFTHKTIDELPVGRSILAITSLAPGVVAGIGAGSLQISGAMSFDNLYTVDGVVVQENLRGQPHNLFIEDAIQETSVTTAGAISAEYGNFTGGVINAISKSGGNDFSGSFRDSLTNPDWTAKTPFRDAAGNPEADHIDSINSVYEATLGGRILRDRLWFFTAGRKSKESTQGTFRRSSETFPQVTDEKRLQARLTAVITPRHNIVAGYLKSPTKQTNNCQFGCYDSSALDVSRELPLDFKTLFYNGVITNNLLVEGKYTEKNFAFVGSGGDDKSLIGGTTVNVLAAAGNQAGFINAPPFCGVCTDELRNNRQWGGKVSYFLGTKSLGSHNVVAGYDHWSESRLANNYQSGSNFRIDIGNRLMTKDASGNWLISIIQDNDYVVWFPIANLSNGSKLDTNAYYVNDSWDLSPRWRFNLGVRYDANDGKDSAGGVVADDSKLSPRLGATYDVFGNGRLSLRSSFAVYAGRLAETIANGGSSFGTPATFAYSYDGPSIIDRRPEDAIRQFFDWFNSHGGTNQTETLFFASIPGLSTHVQGSLATPNVREWTIGATTNLGNHGILRADYIDRDWKDFYSQDHNLASGKATDQFGQKYDISYITNTDDLTRTYRAVALSGQYQFHRLNVGGNYTWSQLRGNVTGETSGSGPVTSGTGNDYPEYSDFARNNPVGFLTTDQTHKLRAWAGMDFKTPAGNFNVTALERYDSGTPYSLVAGLDLRSRSNFYGTGQPGGIANPGYAQNPGTGQTFNYFFSDRGQYRFDGVRATDLALNYNTDPAWMHGASLFAQAELINAFNEHALTIFSTSLLTASNDATLKRFNPMAGDVPVEGVQWRKSSTFGKARTAADYQIARTYRFSLGLRF